MATPTYSCVITLTGGTPQTVASPTTAITVPVGTANNFSFTLTSSSPGAMSVSVYNGTTLATTYTGSTGTTLTISNYLNAVKTVTFKVTQAASGTYVSTSNVVFLTLTSVVAVAPTLTATYSLDGAAAVPITLGGTISLPQRATAVAGKSLVLTVSSNSTGLITLAGSPGTGITETFSSTATSASYTITSVATAGNYTYSASQAAATVYSALASKTVAVLAFQPSPTVTPNAHSGTSITAVAGATYAMAATTSPSVALTYTLAPGAPTEASIDPSTGLVTLGVSAGTYSVIVNYAGSTSIGSLINASAGSFTTLSVPRIGTLEAIQIVYTSESPNVTLAQPTSQSTGAFTWSIISGPGAINDSTKGIVTLSGSAGKVLIGVTQAQTGPWAAVSTVQQVAAITVLVLPTITTGSAQTVTWSANATVAAGVSSPNTTKPLVYSISGSAYGATVDSSGKVSLSGYTLPVAGKEGKITVLVSQAAGGIYAAVTDVIAAVITVNPLVPTISPKTASTPFISGGTYNFASTSISDSPGALTYAISNGPTGTVVATNGVVTIGLFTGVVSISITQGASGNFAAITVPVAAGTLTITRTTPVLSYNGGGTLPQNQSGAYSATQAVNMSVISNSLGLLVYSLASGAPSGTTINPSTGSVNVGGLGTITVRVSQTETGNFFALSNVTVGTITSRTGAPTITKQPYQTLNYVDKLKISPQASSNSQGALSYALHPDSPAIISDDGLTITVTAVGTIIVYAVQAAESPYTALSAADAVIAGTYNIVNAPISASVAFKSPSYLGNVNQLYMTSQDQFQVQPSGLAMLTRTYACALPYLRVARAKLFPGSTPYTPKNAVSYPNVFLFRKPSENNDEAFSTLQCQYYGVRDSGDFKQLYITTGSEIRTVNGSYTIYYGSALNSTSLSFTAKYVSPIITQSWVQYSAQSIVTSLPVLPYDSSNLFDVIFTNANITGTNTSNAPIPLNSLVSQLGSLNEAVASIPGLSNSPIFSIQNTSPRVSLLAEVVSIDSTNYGIVSEVTVKYGAAISSGLNFY